MRRKEKEGGFIILLLLIFLVFSMLTGGCGLGLSIMLQEPEPQGATAMFGGGIGVFTILGWILYILIVVPVVKIFYVPKASSQIPGYLAAIVGSFIGGFFNWMLGYGDSAFAASGFIMGIVGTISFLYLYDNYLVKILNYGQEDNTK